jgi:hypothetical protein
LRIGEIGSISERRCFKAYQYWWAESVITSVWLLLLAINITINQFRPAMCGMSVCGEPINGEEWPFTWQINVPNSSVRYSYSGLHFVGTRWHHGVINNLSVQ